MRVCAEEYDKKYLMRNFPLSYFQNVDLLFKMIGKKKRFIKNTYTSQLKKSQAQEEMAEAGSEMKRREEADARMEVEDNSKWRGKDVRV